MSTRPLSELAVDLRHCRVISHITVPRTLEYLLHRGELPDLIHVEQLARHGRVRKARDLIGPKDGMSAVADPVSMGLDSAKAATIPESEESTAVNGLADLMVLHRFSSLARPATTRRGPGA